MTVPTLITGSAGPVADTLARTSTGEAVVFWLLGVVAVIGALGVVMANKAVYSALFLAMTMLSLAVFYFLQDAMFLGVVQIVVYTGAVMMLFLFVMMLIGVDSRESLVETLRGQRIAGLAAGLGFGVLLIGAIGAAAAAPASVTATAGPAPGTDGNVEGLAALIFTRYLWAFELTGALLVTAVLAAMVLAHRERLTARPTQRSCRSVASPTVATPPRCRHRGSMPATTPSTSLRCCPTDRSRSCRCRGCCINAPSATPETPPAATSRGPSSESRQLPVPLGAAVHHRRSRGLVETQRDRHVHVHRADAQRRQPGVGDILAHPRPARRPDGGVLHDGGGCL